MTSDALSPTQPQVTTRPAGFAPLAGTLAGSALLMLIVAGTALLRQAGAATVEPRAVLLVTAILSLALVAAHGWVIWALLQGRAGVYDQIRTVLLSSLAVLILLPNPFLFDGETFSTGPGALAGIAIFLLELGLAAAAIGQLRRDDVRIGLHAKRPVAWGSFLGIVGLLYAMSLFGPVAEFHVPTVIGKMASNPTLVLQFFLVGLANGAILAIIALGYTMVYGIIELINFAHGDVFMIGAFASLTVFGFFNVNNSTPDGVKWLAIGVALVVAVVFCALLNAGIERLAYSRLRNAPRLAPLISAIGVSFILLNLGLFWGSLRVFFPIMGANAAAPKSFPTLLANDNLLAGLNITGLQIGTKDLLVFLIAVSLMIVLRLFVQYTRLGKAMRATAQNRDAAKIMGIDIDRVITITFLIGGGLAGAAGLLFGVYIGTAVFTMGFTAGLRAFTAAVLGGIGNTTGAMLGGFLIGLLISFSDGYLSADWTNAWVFLTLVVILIFRPNGLLGEYVAEKA